MRVGGYVVDGGDGVFEFFPCGGFTGDEASGGCVRRFLGRGWRDLRRVGYGIGGRGWRLRTRGGRPRAQLTALLV